MNYDACTRITRANAKSFYFASFPLPKEKRNATYATYAFCRTADDIVDEAAPGTEDEARKKLSDLRRLLLDIDDGRVPDHELWGPFAHSIRRFQIPTAPFYELLDGVESDLTPRRFEGFSELRHYCYQVASTVGLALAHIFEFQDDHALDYAANMGIAMQLTNIVRDIGTDWKIGRLYLPRTEMAQFGVTEEMIAEGRVTPELRALLRFHISRAREYYRRAFQGIRYLERDGSHWTALLMGDVYRAILSEVEKNDYDVFTMRASTTLGRKVRRSALAPWVFWRDVVQTTRPIITLPETSFRMQKWEKGKSS